jgi:acetate CoA/acetoacetate CoA-transferase alpha subunit
MKTTTVAAAVALIPDGATLMIGGFMAVGTPERLVDELCRQERRGLTVIANDTAMPGVGIGKLVTAHRLRKVVVSHIGTNPETQRQMLDGALEVELVPQGTLIERIRAGGYGLGVLADRRRPRRAASAASTSTFTPTCWRRPLAPDFTLVQALADFAGNRLRSLRATVR